MSENAFSDHKLLTPFVFLKLKYSEKSKFNIGAIVVAACATATFVFLPSQPKLLNDNGILLDLQSFVTILFPFLVGALVAVCTFERKTLDDLPLAGQVKLLREGRVDYSLTRREFVSLLFGYCAALSILIFILIFIAKFLYPTLSILISNEVARVIKPIFVFLFLLLFSHLLIITFWGMYYLTFRIRN